jgi:uncharacterized protein YegP (UPF0339 family)
LHIFGLMKRPGFFSCTIVFFTLAAFESCKDFIEPSIEKRQILIEAPSNGFQTPLYKVNFWWDEVEDALGYRLQVVSPRFDSPDKLVLDTLVNSNKFSGNLDPGKYEWRLRAENGSTVTAYSPARTFEVLQSSIKQQAVELSTPTNGLLTNNAQLNFQWETLYGATKYHLQIDTNNFANDEMVVYDQSLPINQLTYNLSKDQAYQWRVRAENDTAQARWSAVNRFTFDRLPPARVKAVTPSDNQSIAKPVHIAWETAATAVRYRLYVLKADSTNNYNDSFPVIVNAAAYDFQSGNSGERVYWKVSAIDAAGNEGATSIARSFTIQ